MVPPVVVARKTVQARRKRRPHVKVRIRKIQDLHAALDLGVVVVRDFSVESFAEGTLYFEKKFVGKRVRGRPRSYGRETELGRVGCF